MTDPKTYRAAFRELLEAADEMRNSLPGHWHDDATIRLTDAAADGWDALKAAEQDDLYVVEPRPDSRARADALENLAKLYFYNAWPRKHNPGDWYNPDEDMERRREKVCAVAELMLSAIQSAPTASAAAGPAEEAQDTPGLVVVPAEQFDALVEMLDHPPEVPEELRREAANRRWK